MIQMGLFEWVYIITNIFWTYTIFKFMGVFFNVRKYDKKIEYLTYAVFYVLSTALFLFINVPIVFIIFNLFAFIALTYNYESSIKNRILSVVLIYLILAGVEVIIGLFSGYIDFSLLSMNTYSSIFGIIACRIISYAVVLVLNNFQNIKRGQHVPTTYWVSLVIIPATSLYVILTLFQAEGISAIQTIIGVLLILLINFATFYLYDVITAVLSDRMQNLLIMEQNKYYDKQLNTMKSYLQTTKSIRHDLKNHLISIRTLIENGDTKECLGYISDILQDIGTRRDYSDSGNTVIDSIINFKFQEAEQRKIKAELDLKIPDKLEIPSLDITVILGNLLDNAIKAASKVEEGAFISLKMRFDKGRLMIQSVNPYIGEIVEQKGNLITTEKDKENHGYGLQNIKKVIQKYDGTMDIDYSNNLFSITLLLYLD